LLRDNTGIEKASRRRLWLAAAALPFLVCAAFAFAFAYDAPYWDEWIYLAPIVRAFEGELSLSDFVVRINEHLCVVPSLIVIPLARATQWDLRWEICVVLAIYAGVFALLYRALRRAEQAAGRPGSMWAAPCLGTLLFSGSQYALWNWSLLVTLASAAFFSVVALGQLSSRNLNARRLALAGLCGWAATFSIGGGLSVWPAGVVALLLRVRPKESRRWPALAAWIAIGAAAAGLYLSAGSTHSLDMARQATNPLAVCLYVLAFLGGPLAVGQGGVAVVLGGLLLAALGFLSLRSASHNGETDRETRPFMIGLVGAALVVGFLTAAKHAHEGVENAISSRFLPWGTLAWCALVIGVYARFPMLGAAPGRLRVALAAGLVAVLASSALGFYKADERHDAFLLGRRALIENPASDDLKFLHPAPETLGPSRDLLIKYRLTVFRETVASR